MRGIEGLYTAISAIINQREEENRLAIEANDIVESVKNEVDVYSATLDWYINFALKAAAEVGLYQKGYRSVVKGEGLFVNLYNCNNEAYLKRLFNNAKLTEMQKQKVVDMIRKQITANTLDGQMTIDFSTGSLVEEVTEAKLLEMLRADAR